MRDHFDCSDPLDPKPRPYPHESRSRNLGFPQTPPRGIERRFRILKKKIKDGPPPWGPTNMDRHLGENRAIQSWNRTGVDASFQPPPLFRLCALLTFGPTLCTKGSRPIPHSGKGASCFSVVRPLNTGVLRWPCGSYGQSGEIFQDKRGRESSMRPWRRSWPWPPSSFSSFKDGTSFWTTSRPTTRTKSTRSVYP